MATLGRILVLPPELLLHVEVRPREVDLLRGRTVLQLEAGDAAEGDYGFNIPSILLKGDKMDWH